jgi:hypothetical protein
MDGQVDGIESADVSVSWIKMDDGGMEFRARMYQLHWWRRQMDENLEAN